jgi:hypothetical protein
MGKIKILTKKHFRFWLKRFFFVLQMLILNKCGLQNHIGFSGYITERAG